MVVSPGLLLLQSVVLCPPSALKNSGRSKHCLSSVDSAVFFLSSKSEPSDFFPCPSREARSHRKWFPMLFSFPVWSLVACLFKSLVIFNMWLVFFFLLGLRILCRIWIKFLFERKLVIADTFFQSVEFPFNNAFHQTGFFNTSEVHFTKFPRHSSSLLNNFWPEIS